jgi:hypothetical protein
MGGWDDPVYVTLRLDRDMTLDALAVFSGEREARRQATDWAAQEIPDTGWQVEVVRLGFGQEWTDGEVIWSSQEEE